MSDRVAMQNHHNATQHDINLTVITDGSINVAATVSPNEMETRHSKIRRIASGSDVKSSYSSEQDQQQSNSNEDFTGAYREDDDTNRPEDQEEENDMTDPDWDKIMLHEPARTDVPIFLNARDRRDTADLRFGQALDEFHETLNSSVKGILGAVAEIHEVTSIKLNQMEDDLKANFEMNEKSRAEMAQMLQDSAAAAQGLFANLLMKVEQGIVKRTK